MGTPYKSEVPDIDPEMHNFAIFTWAPPSFASNQSMVLHGMPRSNTGKTISYPDFRENEPFFDIGVDEPDPSGAVGSLPMRPA